MERQTDRRTDRQTQRQTERKTDKQKDRQIETARQRQPDRQAPRQPDSQADRQTDGQADFPEMWSPICADPTVSSLESLLFITPFIGSKSNEADEWIQTKKEQKTIKQ